MHMNESSHVLHDMSRYDVHIWCINNHTFFWLRPCIIRRVMMCTYGSACTDSVWCRKKHPLIWPCPASSWGRIHQVLQVPEACSRTMFSMTMSCRSLGSDSPGHAGANRPRCSRNMIRMIIEVPGGALCPCPCQGPCRHQVLQLPEALVCRHSSHPNLRW